MRIHMYLLFEKDKKFSEVDGILSAILRQMFVKRMFRLAIIHFSDVKI